MNPLLQDIEGKDEFVITPEPNAYIVTLRLTPEQAKVFADHDRISIAIASDGDDSFGLMYVGGVAENNEPTTYRLSGEMENCDFTPEQEAILTSPDISARVGKAVTDFVSAVREDLPEYYAAVKALRSTFTA